jgi:hypothetical protein
VRNVGTTTRIQKQTGISHLAFFFFFFFALDTRGDTRRLPAGDDSVEAPGDDVAVKTRRRPASAAVDSLSVVAAAAAAAVSAVAKGVRIPSRLSGDASAPAKLVKKDIVDLRGGGLECVGGFVIGFCFVVLDLKWIDCVMRNVVFWRRQWHRCWV